VNRAAAGFHGSKCPTTAKIFQWYRGNPRILGRATGCATGCANFCATGCVKMRNRLRAASLLLVISSWNTTLSSSIRYASRVRAGLLLPA
jgi:hypothetical protein